MPLFGNFITSKHYLRVKPNARLRGWQRITLNLITTTETTAAHWDWKRHALTVPLEAFVRRISSRVIFVRFTT
ncbi:hypothetical protein FLL85_17270 [Vibrio cholerae]|nr:hypothetical protein FLL92_15865 [Vibrio cholerae]TQP57375.1 hypothetical protein FLL81_15415 [Vibrio cholerae]TQQ20019.1 hypothetical protein FLL85_17270 [Vibrio cholerae]